MDHLTIEAYLGSEGVTPNLYKFYMHVEWSTPMRDEVVYFIPNNPVVRRYWCEDGVPHWADTQYGKYAVKVKDLVKGEMEWIREQFTELEITNGTDTATNTRRRGILRGG